MWLEGFCEVLNPDQYLGRSLHRGCVDCSVVHDAWCNFLSLFKEIEMEQCCSCAVMQRIFPPCCQMFALEVR